MAKKGFTLMELLLVVAVLAIVAAAAAPTFFGGAQEAMDEAKKATMNSAYQNCISGSNMLMAIAASKGITPTADTVPLSWTDPANPASGSIPLSYYTPAPARVFTNKAGTSYIFSAKYNNTSKKVVVVYAAGSGSAEPSDDATEVTGNNTTEALNTVWTAVNQ